MGLLLLMFGYPVFGADSQPTGSLEDFIRLNENLPKAVCDNSVLSRSPNLSAAPETDSTGKESLSAISSVKTRYYLHYSFAEEEAIGFLMEDPDSGIWTPLLKQMKTASGTSLDTLKGRISLEVCTGLVTPGKLKSMAVSDSRILFPLQPESEGNKRLGDPLVLLQDSEGRFGKVNGKWWAGGWIEPYEVISIRMGKRLYGRVFQPITNQTLAIQVATEKGLPLGYLVPSTETPDFRWKTLLNKAKTPVNLGKRLEIYRTMIESEAYLALARFPKRGDEIRKLQEFYKSLLSAYQLYPSGEQFESYAKRAKGAPSEEGLKKILDASFFKALSRARVNGAPVGIGVFIPDGKLHAIYEEYLSRIQKLTQ